MNTSQYPAIVQAIHNEFNLAGERLLQESLGIIHNAEKIDIQKASRLNGVGFVNNPLVTKQKNIEEITKTPSEWAKIVMEYKKKFPLHKFISDIDIANICKKYILYMGNVGQYKGFVPDKNLKEIEQFKTKYAEGLKKFHINKMEFEYRSVEGYDCRRIEEYVNSKKGNLIGHDLNGIQNFLKYDLLKDSKYGHVTITITDAVELPLFDICAPKRDMINNNKWKLINNLFDTKFIYIPDPVVLFPVEHGAIIVTAWGDEASDPLVVNELNN